MKKANFSLVIASVAFLFFLGVGSLSAQTLGVTTANFNGKVIDVTGVNFVDVTNAQDILKNQAVSLLADPTGLSLQDEANATARGEYYGYLLSLLDGAANLNDVLPASAVKLGEITSRYKAAMNVKPEEIFQETVDMLSL